MKNHSTRETTTVCFGTPKCQPVVKTDLKYHEYPVHLSLIRIMRTEGEPEARLEMSFVTTENDRPGCNGCFSPPAFVTVKEIERYFFRKSLGETKMNPVPSTSWVYAVCFEVRRVNFCDVATRTIARILEGFGIKPQRSLPGKLRIVRDTEVWYAGAWRSQGDYRLLKTGIISI